MHPARAKAPTLGRCEVLGSRTIRGTKEVRVFTASDGYFACLARSNRPFPLVRKSEVAYGLDIVSIQIAAPYVGFGYVLDGPDFASVAHVRVLDLRDGSWKHDLLAIDHASNSEVSDIALSHAGGLAWISRGYADIAGKEVPAGCRRTSSIRCDFGYEVRDPDRRGARTLDSARDIAPKSLAVDGKRVSWRRATRGYSAALR